MPIIYVDADACPVKNEIERVATRHGVRVILVADGGIRPSENPLVEVVFVEPGMDAADQWIAEHIGAHDICITNDIPLAAQCIHSGACVLRPNGVEITERNVGDVVATRNLMQSLRDAGEVTGGPAPYSKRDRSSFLNALEGTLQKVSR